MSDRSSRQSFLGAKSERTLSELHVGIVGLGGGGSHIAQQLAHFGILHFTIIDPDKVEESNLNRLIGATLEDAKVAEYKTRVARRLMVGVNPTATINCVEGLWQEHHRALRDCDLIFGCLDRYRDRSELETLARRYHIPYVDIGMDVHAIGDVYVVAGQVILSMPGSLCLRCMGFLRDDLLIREAENYGAAGVRPQVVWANGVLASLAVGLLAQLFTPWHSDHRVSIYLEYDGNSQTVTTSNRLALVMNRPCPHFTNYEDLGDPFWVPGPLN